MDNFISINNRNDIPDVYRDSPIGHLLEYHNLNRKHEQYTNAYLLIGMCMDNRKKLNIPERFAYILRTGGADLRYSEFHISYAISMSKIAHIALIGHNDCGMVNLSSRKKLFIEGLVNTAGWDESKAEERFNNLSPKYEIGNPEDFTLAETIRLRSVYPKIIIAPLMYSVDDNKLYIIKEP